MVLIVDDEPDIRAALSVQLEYAGYGTWQAENGQQPVDMAVEKRPDVILLDLMMPVMSGLKALQLIKADERTSSIPVIVLSALGAHDVLNDAIRAGARDYIVKPWDENDVERSVEWAIKGGGLRPARRPEELLRRLTSACHRPAQSPLALPRIQPPLGA
jgi:CheY-like chemotaxis protein